MASLQPCSRVHGTRRSRATRRRSTNLLWALESLAWGPQYLGRVSIILAKLAARDLARTLLEIQILEAMGDRTTAQDLRWKTFETSLDIGMLRDHIARLPDFAEFDVLDKAFAHAIAFEQKYCALAFFLNWPRLDLAAKLVLDRRAEWKGRHYEALLAAAETLEPDHPVAATILYRALLDDILNRARSPAYGHAARYLETLDAIAAHGDPASSIDPHHAYRAALSQKHGRKSAFGASSRCESDPKRSVTARFGMVTFTRLLVKSPMHVTAHPYLPDGIEVR